MFFSSRLTPLIWISWHKTINVSKFVIFARTKKFFWGRMTFFGYQAYMWISIEIKFQLALVIFPKIVYNHSGTMIFHQVELKIKTRTVYQQYRHETMIHRITILAPKRADVMWEKKNIRLICSSNNKRLPVEEDQPHQKMVTTVPLFQHFYSNHPE